MDIEQKRNLKRSLAYKEMMAPENKENFNTENTPLNNNQTYQNNIKKPEIKPSKALAPNNRYFETQAEKMGFLRKEHEQFCENPQKTASVNQAQIGEAKKAKTSRANIIKFELKPSETEKEHLEQHTEISSALEPKENKKLKITKAKIQKKNEKAATAVFTERMNFTEGCAGAQSGNLFSLNNEMNNANDFNNVGVAANANASENGFGALKQQVNMNSQAQGSIVVANNEDLNTKRNKREVNEISEKAEANILVENCNNNNNKAANNTNNNNLNNNINNNNYNQAVLTKNATNDDNKSTKPKKATTMRDYLDKENVIIIRNYGSDIYNYMRSMECVEVQSNFLDRHKINPEIRTKMVDWMVEVLSVYKCEQETFFLSVYIMDSYIFKTTVVLTTDDVHVIGLTAMFVASKFEDVIPIRMNSLVSKIGHDLFTYSQVAKLERKMCEVVEFDKLIISSIYEFIRTFFYDFKFNNRRYITKLKMEEEIKDLENCSILFAKLMFYPTLFYSYNFLLKAITCIICAFDTLRNAGKFISVESEGFFREWIMFLIEENSFTNEEINEVYLHLTNYHADYDKIPLISHNLNKFPL